MTDHECCFHLMEVHLVIRYPKGSECQCMAGKTVAYQPPETEHGRFRGLRAVLLGRVCVQEALDQTNRGRVDVTGLRPALVAEATSLHDPPVAQSDSTRVGRCGGCLARTPHFGRNALLSRQEAS